MFLLSTLLALWLHGCWWSHVEITSIQGAVISFYWDQWHAWSRPFSFTPTDPLFSPIQPWWLLSHHCLHPPMVAQWTPVCRSLPDRLLSVKKPTARGSPFVTYPRGGWMAFSFDLYFAIFPPQHWIFLSHTFQMWQSSPMSWLLDTFLVLWCGPSFENFVWGIFTEVSHGENIEI